VAHERPRVEHRVEVELRRRLGDQLAERPAGVPGALGGGLDDPVGVVARPPRLHQGEQRALGIQRTVRRLEVPPHAVGVHGHALDHADRERLGIVEQDRRVGQGDPLDRGVRDVALVPEGDVLEPGLGVAAQQAGDPRYPLCGDRVALVGHRRGSLLPGPERLLGLAQLGALEAAELDREALEAGAREGDRRQELGVAIARDHLGRDLLAAEAEAVEHAALEVGAGGRVGPHRARQRAHLDLGEG
jgi:hypothetical protein